MARAGVLVGVLMLACSPGVAPEAAEHCDEPSLFVPQTLLVYRVEYGDSLSQIAQRFHIEGGPRLLASINHLTNIDQIRANAGLLIPQNKPWTNALPLYQPEQIVSPDRRFCESKEWSPVESKRLPAFAQKECGAKKADCSSGHGQQVCFCAGDEEGAGKFIWLDQKQVKAVWAGTPANFFNTSGGARVFSVRQLDLDQDARDEVAVFAFEAGNNGAPIDTSYAAILSEGNSSPLLFTDDGSLENLFVVGSEGCEIQTTTWSDYIPQLESAGLYQKRESYRYQGGALYASATFPVSFQRFGGQLWKSWPVHPERAGEISSRSGVIESISTKPDTYARYVTTFTLRFSDGTRKDFVYHAGLWGSEFDEDWKNAISTIGDSSVIYPYEYWPADVSQWQGRAVNLSVLFQDDGYRQALWLQ
jgi:hypothetical protein